MKKVANSQKEVIFRIQQEEYGISITEILSIEKSCSITPIANQNPFFIGVTDLRGTIIPIIDMCKVFNYATTSSSESRCYIMVMVKNQIFGLMVDAATDIVEVPSDVIQKMPSFFSEFIYGMAQLGTRMIVLLDLPTLLSTISTDRTLPTLSDTLR
ncbi:hypothetical protein C2W64_03743 [Brevibacillus laterosporus]|uniref:Purine-binding chemotaxis protein CheW n=1 Tax=Brevibacillus laterosporus TaxID=1465 RepID=A0A518VAZ3_BRELA|nr:chemotaxis protein CheW [Brevibacillus laterosporus]QDX94160.1 purine-binding chemotaxis protein CheW [Brevibacillus laterosporus]RAP29394.1 hypothetical protein C2W64_03743 [Brevibacillus laterosporus]